MLPVFRKVRPRATVAPIELTLVLIMFPSQILKLGGTTGDVSSFFPPFIYLYNLEIFYVFMYLYDLQIFINSKIPCLLLFCIDQGKM